jgi:pseudouridine synthase
MIRAVEERLQKILARAGFASRRGAEGLMQEGRVTVNGTIIREPGTKADPTRDDIRVDGVRVKAAGDPVYILLNKPRGVVTTRRDPSGRPTVMDLVPGVSGLFPVGRLDLTTEGLILLTNDGAFAERVSHPRYEVPRVYHAKVRGVPDARTLERLRHGVRVKDEVLAADGVRLVEIDRNAWVEITLHEGKQHEVKRLLEAVGHPVSKLRRVAFGPVTLRGLQPGEFRALDPGEVAGLLRGEKSRSIPTLRTRRRPRASVARKTGARQATARKTAERRDARGEAGGRRIAGGTTGERGTAARKTGPRTTDARKAGARKADARATDARKAGGRKTGARTADARKAGARKADARVTDARKAGGRKTGARTTDARKAGARKADARATDARKAGGRKTDARKSSARKTEARGDAAGRAGTRKAGSRSTGSRKAGGGRSAGPGSNRPPERRGSSTGAKRGARKATRDTRDTRRRR